MDDGPKRAGQDKPKAGQATTASETATAPGTPSTMPDEMQDAETVPETAVLAAGAESDQTGDDLLIQTAEDAEIQIPVEATVAQDVVKTLPSQDVAKTLPSQDVAKTLPTQASDVKAEEAGVKTGVATAGDNVKLTPGGEQSKTGAVGVAAKAEGPVDVAKTPIPAAKDTAPSETRNADSAQQRSVAGDPANAGAGTRHSEAGKTAGNIGEAVPKATAGNAAAQSAQVVASANAAVTSTQAAAASTEAGLTLGQGAEVPEEVAQRLASTGNGTLATQHPVAATQSPSGSKVTAMGEVSASAKAGDAVSAKVAQNAQANTDINVETVVRDAAGKVAPSGEALMAAAGQSRAAATAEPGRRAQGRESEAREAQASTSGNGTAIGTGSSATTVAKTAAVAQVSAVQQAFAAQVLGADASAAAAAKGDGLLLGSEAGPEMPGLSQLLTEAVLQPGTVHRPETPRLIAAQLAQALVAKGERNVEVALNPEELGRVKMRVTTSDTGITVVIQTERPETGDLMRRHINELADEFRRMGFDNVSFEFNGGGTSDSQTNSDGDGQSAAGGSPLAQSDDMAAAPVADIPTQQLRMGNAGVDMRV